MAMIWQHGKGFFISAACSLLVLWVQLSACLTLLANDPHGQNPVLREKITSRIRAHRGQVALAIKNLKTGESFLHRADVPMPTASLIKFPVMVEAYRQAKQGKVKLDRMVTLRDEDKVPGSGILTSHFSSGTQISLRDAIHLMIVYSDNTATNLVLDAIGIRSVADTMDQLECPNTRIHAKVFRRDTSVFPARSKKYGLGSTTATEMVRLYELLHQEKLVGAEQCRQMREHLLQCEDRTKLARLLPQGTKIAHKGGAVSSVRCDAGLIQSPAGTLAVCVLTQENEDRSWSDDNAGNRFCADIAQIAYRHFNDELSGADATEPATLRKGDSGRLVEDLQRTLNRRLSPSPELAVDGDFGPRTEAAVVRFQQERQLAANGQVDAATWQALGHLVTQDPPPAPPQQVNAEQLPQAPPDTLDGVPHVTCKAWAIADGKSGQMLWEANADARRHLASTTKLMTAFVIFKLAQSEPQVLDEEVVFSTRADETPGSTAGVRAGEKLSVRELLYGLLLPSGNDASVALAEHFGPRFDPPQHAPGAKSADQTDPLQRFVAEMNRTARTLAMEQTHYANPHGLTVADHLSTARDQVRLAHAALGLPPLRQYVATRQRGCTLSSVSGYQRNVLWKNTNRLLGIGGYDGIKTGTTSAAGCCLVSSARRGDDHLILVVLGATSSDARYVDSRNLFRWAWKQRGQGR